MAVPSDLTLSFDSPDEEGWIVARILKVPGAVSQGRTREEASENVLGQEWVRKGIEQLRRGELTER